MTTVPAPSPVLVTEHQENTMRATMNRPRTLRRVLLVAAVAGGAHLGGVSVAAPAFSAGDVCDLCSINFDLLACEESGGEPYDSNPGGSQGTPTVPAPKPTANPSPEPVATTGPKPTPNPVATAAPKPTTTVAPKPAATTAPKLTKSKPTSTKPKSVRTPKPSARPTAPPARPSVEPTSVAPPRTESTPSAAPSAGVGTGTSVGSTQPAADTTPTDNQPVTAPSEVTVTDELPAAVATGDAPQVPVTPTGATVVSTSEDAPASAAAVDDATTTAAAQEAAAARVAGLGLLGALAATGVALLTAHAVRGRRRTR